MAWLLQREGCSQPYSLYLLLPGEAPCTTDEVQPHLTCNLELTAAAVLEDSGNSVRPSLEQCCAPVPPTPLWDFPHLLLLSLFLLFELIQHGLETGLQTQTWTPELAVCSQQNGCCCHTSHGAVTTTPLSPPVSQITLPPQGNAGVCTATPQLFLIQ